MHWHILTLFKECLVTQDIVRITLHDLYHWKAVINAFKLPRIEKLSIRGWVVIINTPHMLTLFKECHITWDLSMLVPYTLYCLKAIIITFQMSADRKHFYPRLFWYYRYNMALWKSIHSKEWLITLDIFKLIDYAASHFKALLNDFNMTMHRKCFYPRLLGYYKYKMHLLIWYPLKNTL